MPSGMHGMDYCSRCKAKTEFQHSADAANNLTELKKTDPWQQAAYVEKGGWATMPGSKAADSGVSQACAAILSAK